MTITDFLSTLFTRFRFNGQLDKAHKAGSEHAKAVVTSYMDGFEETAAEILAARSQRLIGGPVVKSVRAKIGKGK